ncbi:hypothetical protein IAQ61_003313 [Plenodomus lingam]|uniref:uncharacterized protein n=1 Tax=Leptosphaeria maculans TaxID=5022 RepID=UPI00332FB00B|nr:hypothetical protein IAQ61_003313 [Plenodomus lingam]
MSTQTSLVIDNQDQYNDCGEDGTNFFLRLPLVPDIREYDDESDEDVTSDDWKGHADEAY